MSCFFILIISLLSFCHPSSDREARAGALFEAYKDSLLASAVRLDGDFLREDTLLRQSAIYEIIKIMPKGADLHVHSSALLPFKEKMEFLASCPDILICTNPDSLGYLVYDKYAVLKEDKNYISASDALDGKFPLTKLKDAMTMSGSPLDLPAWDWFLPLFGKVKNTTPTRHYYEEYYTTAFMYYASLGIMHIEPRMAFMGDKASSLEDCRALYRAQNRVREWYPDFSVSIVFSGLKMPSSVHLNDIIFENALYLCDHIKDTLAGMSDFVVAFDFAQEEDKSFPLVSFTELIEKTKTANPNLHISFHAGESLLESNDEIRSAINFGAERIGHSYNLYRHPELKQIMKERGICIESCPVSNHVLGYCADLEEHPVRQYLADGLAVTLCDDDPSFQESVSLVDDYLAAAIYWDLSLREIKQLCRNSVTCSFLPDAHKEKLLKWWEEEWNKFIDVITSFQN